MRRIRWALLGVALGLGIPVALLAWRALEGLTLERAVRHQALAERAFDEMERSLSDWLRAEEARPFEDYRFYRSPGERSPLSSPTDAFVIGAFQIDPDGSVHTPLRPRDEAAAGSRGDWPASPEVEDAALRVTTLARETWIAELQRRVPERADAKAGGKGADPAFERQAPGTTRALGGPLAGRLEKSEKADADALAEEESVSVYSALQGLNRGADLRAQRKQKVTEAKLPDDYAYAQSAAPVPSAPRARTQESDTFVFGGFDPEPPAAERDAATSVGEVFGDLGQIGYLLSEAPKKESALDEVRRAEAPEEGGVGVRLALDPMVGRSAGDGVLLLYRTVLVGEQGYRQGLALDRAKLATWLTDRALAPSGLSRIATLRFDEASVPATVDTDFVFQHRFAEPFDAITAQLSLAALPGVGSPGTIYALVALLVGVGAAGLFAVYRMVAVAVHFAERRSNFVSAVTHELKTPLTAIRMYGEMLRDGLVTTDAKRDEYYGTITDESERLSRLIDNVLEFSRLERGTREMSFHVGPLEPVVREAAEKLRAHAAKQGFSLEVEVASDLPPVRYDRDALLQVIFNLVDNAMKYAHGASARRVVIEAQRAGTGIELSVRDFGPGVSRGHLSKIFEPFYRGEDEMTRTTKGTGIGLALVRDLAERMGARVQGDNVPEGGFRVRLAFDPAGAAS